MRVPVPTMKVIMKIRNDADEIQLGLVSNTSRELKISL